MAASIGGGRGLGGLDKGAQIPGRTHMTQQGGREKGRGLEWTSGIVTAKSKALIFVLTTVVIENFKLLKIEHWIYHPDSEQILLPKLRRPKSANFPTSLRRLSSSLPVVNLVALNEGLKCEGGCVRP